MGSGDFLRYDGNMNSIHNSEKVPSLFDLCALALGKNYHAILKGKQEEQTKKKQRDESSLASVASIYDIIRRPDGSKSCMGRKRLQDTAKETDTYTDIDAEGYYSGSGIMLPSGALERALRLLHEQGRLQDSHMYLVYHVLSQSVVDGAASSSFSSLHSHCSDDDQDGGASMFANHRLFQPVAEAGKLFDSLRYVCVYGCVYQCLCVCRVLLLRVCAQNFTRYKS